MTFFVLFSIGMFVCVGKFCLLKKLRNQGVRSKGGKKNPAKTLCNERIIACPSCAQQIKFTIPIKGNKAKCRKCAAQFKITVDVHGNVYITEIKLPEEDSSIKSLEECCLILDVRADAIPMDIRTAYKKKISEYHPDRVENLGLKIKEVAEDETRKINAAYAMLQESERV